MPRAGGSITLVDLHPRVEDLRGEVLDGLARPQKSLPCKLFYDERGSRLYEEITRLPEYYLTRTEISIMREQMDEIAALLGRRVLMVEYGSGTSEKTRIVLRALEDPAAYMPLDISKDHLLEAAAAVAAEFPGLEVLPVCADYTSEIELPTLEVSVARRVVYFPGSTIGNFTPLEAREFFERMARYCAPGDVLLLGADLKKDREVLEAAYNDDRGVTAEFNLNLLRRLNHELGANFDLEGFAHRAVYDEGVGRIEMLLVSRRRQTVRIDEHTFDFECGETISTEFSYKYTTEEIVELARGFGFELLRVWNDPNRLFSVNYLELTSTPSRAATVATSS